MIRSKDTLIIQVHYPSKEEDILELRKRMGNAYGRFIQNYILNLPINDKEKNKLFKDVVENFLEWR